VKRLILFVAALAVVAATPASAGDPSPSATERAFVGLLNQERAAHDLAPVEISPHLTDVADDYVAFYAASGVGINHEYDPPYTDRAWAGGCSKWNGPVLAQGYTSARAVLDGWLHSPGHRAVLMDSEITHVGPGFAGKYQLMFGLICRRNAQNSSGDFGEVPGGVITRKPKVRGKSIRVSVSATAQTTARLVARQGRTVKRSAKKKLSAGASKRLKVRVPRSGKWKVWVEANGTKHKLGKVRV